MSDDLLAHPPLVDALDIDALPAGEMSRLRLELTRDAIGRPVALPLLVARGAHPGPVFGVTAAVHGDELNGVALIHRLFEELDATKLRGTVVASIVTNMPGFLAQTRRFGQGRDLNHIFPGRKQGRSDDIYAFRLIDRMVRHFDYLVDLHTASRGRINSLYVRADLNHRIAGRFAILQRPQIILHNPPSDFTLRGTAMELGIPSITVEIGDPGIFQPRLIKRTLRGLFDVLREVEMLPQPPASKRGEMPKTPTICERSRWLRTEDGGLLEVFPDICDMVQEGQVVARLRSIWGDVICDYRTPESGVVIGKSVNPSGPSGARILHLGIVSRDERAFPHAHRRTLWTSESTNTGDSQELEIIAMQREADADRDGVAALRDESEAEIVPSGGASGDRGGSDERRAEDNDD